MNKQGLTHELTEEVPLPDHAEIKQAKATSELQALVTSRQTFGPLTCRLYLQGIKRKRRLNSIVTHQKV